MKSSRHADAEADLHGAATSALESVLLAAGGLADTLGRYASAPLTESLLDIIVMAGPWLCDGLESVKMPFLTFSLSLSLSLSDSLHCLSSFVLFQTPSILWGWMSL